MEAKASACRWLLPAAALVVLGLLWANDSTPGHAQSVTENPALASLEIDLWPEFDRPATALVILRAEIAADVPLPATVRVRIPAAAGAPAAVAEAPAADAQLLNVAYQITDAQIDFTTIAFAVTGRFFHLEFYEPLDTSATARSYRYMWPGDFAAAKLTVQVQEPAGASGVSVSPDIGVPVAQADGMLYRQADLGPAEAGKPVAVELKYEKTDPRTSAEILGLAQASAAPTQEGARGSGLRTVLLGIVVAAGAALVVVVVGGVFWGRQRSRVAGPQSRAERRRARLAQLRCPGCSTLIGAGARFCASCGRQVSALTGARKGARGA